MEDSKESSIEDSREQAFLNKRSRKRTRSWSKISKFLTDWGEIIEGIAIDLKNWIKEKMSRQPPLPKNLPTWTKARREVWENYLSMTSFIIFSLQRYWQ